MTFEEWTKIKSYKIDENYSLGKADLDKFAIYCEIYSQSRFTSFETVNWKPSITSKYLENEKYNYQNCRDYTFWIIKNNTRIGGAIISPNYLETFFLIPPYDDLQEFINVLKKALLEISEKTKPITVVHAFGEQIELLKQNGFIQKEIVHRNSGKIWNANTCHMMRPTEKFDINWQEDYLVINPEPQYLEEIIRFNVETFTEDTVEDLTGEAKDYFKTYEKNSILKKAAILVLDKKTNKIISSIMVCLSGDLPTIEAVAVKPEYRGKGLALNMLKHTISVLHEKYPAVRLTVYQDNENAVKLYQKLGFINGLSMIKLCLPVQK